MFIGKRSLVLLCVGVLLPCLWANAMAGTNAMASNGTKFNLTKPVSGRLSSVNVSSLASILKASRAKNNQTITSLHPKVKVSNLGAKINNGSMTANSTDEGKMGANITIKPSHQLKNSGHKSNSSRLLEKFASKLSLVQLTSSSSSSNKTSPAKSERDAANVTLANLKIANASDLTIKTIEKRAVHLSNVTDKASSILRALPALMTNATNNATNWAIRLIGLGNNSSSNVTSKKVIREATTAELGSELNKTSINLTTADNLEQSAVSKAEDKVSMSNSSSLLNRSSVILKHDSSTSERPLTKLNGSLHNASILENKKNVGVNVTLDISETKSNASLKKLTSVNNRTRRQDSSNELDGPRRNAARPAGWMPGMAPAAPSYGYTTPAPYGTTTQGYGYSTQAPPAYAPAPPAYAPAPPAYAPAPPAYAPAPPAYAPAPPAYAPAPPAYAPAAPAYGPSNPPSYTTPTYAPAPTTQRYEYSTPASYTLAAPAYAPAAPVYAQQTESYYTAPPPTYTTPAPYTQPAAPFASQPAPPAPASYPARPYGSMPSRPSTTGSPWI